MSAPAVVALAVGFVLLVVGAVQLWGGYGRRTRAAVAAAIGAVLIVGALALGTAGSDESKERPAAKGPRTKIASDRSHLLKVAVPAGWKVVERSKLSLTVKAPDTSNVIVSSEAVDPPMWSRKYALAQGEGFTTGDFPRYRELSFHRARVLGGWPGYLRRFEWMPEGEGLLRQTQVYYGRADRGYLATGTPADHKDLPRVEKVLKQVKLDL